MKYWEYPDNDYDYNLMPNNSGSAETSSLLYDVAESVFMSYGCDGSYSNINLCPTSLSSFGYSSSGTHVNYDSETLVSQLENNRPVIMAGYDDNYGGHAWVCDGFRRYKLTTIHNPGTINEYETYTYTSPYFHMNWGLVEYGYTNNAWYYYDSFDPGILDFEDNVMVINVYP